MRDELNLFYFILHPFKCPAKSNSNSGSSMSLRERAATGTEIAAETGLLPREIAFRPKARRRRGKKARAIIHRLRAVPWNVKSPVIFIVHRAGIIRVGVKL